MLDESDVDREPAGGQIHAESAAGLGTLLEAAFSAVLGEPDARPSAPSEVAGPAAGYGLVPGPGKLYVESAAPKIVGFDADGVGTMLKVESVAVRVTAVGMTVELASSRLLEVAEWAAGNGLEVGPGPPQ